ncbi:MAG: DUF4349 domain-containing protein [Lachnospiraceae bacterium]|nr:DUF4349 domain-containing protein [Lachnospiraceae bacterium]
MKRRNMNVKGFAVALAAAMLMTGCGGSSMEMAADTASTTTAYYDGGSGYKSNDIYVTEAAAEEAIEYETAEAPAAAEAGESVEVKDTERKLIKNVDLYVETETFDELLVTVESKTEGLGGYIESSYTYNGSSYYGGGRRNASLTIRIPAEKLDEFLSTVAEVSNVTSRNERVEDVTLQYVDLDSHKKTLQAEQDRLLELLDEAETIEDIIALEGRLSEVRYQIESMESQLRTYDNQVDYSTVYLEIEEVNKITPVKEQTVGEKIVTGFTENLYDVGEGLLNFGIWFITHIPSLVVWAVVIFIIVLIIKGIRKHHQKKKLKKQLMQQPAEGQAKAAGVQELKPEASGQPQGKEAKKE